MKPEAVTEIEKLIEELDRAKRDLQMELVKDINVGARRREASSGGGEPLQKRQSLDEWFTKREGRGPKSGIPGTQDLASRATRQRLEAGLLPQERANLEARKRLEYGIGPQDPTIKRVTYYSDDPVKPSWGQRDQSNWEGSGRHGSTPPKARGLQA
jgi:hypothetical protein